MQAPFSRAARCDAGISNTNISVCACSSEGSAETRSISSVVLIPLTREGYQSFVNDDPEPSIIATLFHVTVSWALFWHRRGRRVPEVNGHPRIGVYITGPPPSTVSHRMTYYTGQHLNKQGASPRSPREGIPRLMDQGTIFLFSSSIRFSSDSSIHARGMPEGT